MSRKKVLYLQLIIIIITIINSNRTAESESDSFHSKILEFNDESPTKTIEINAIDNNKNAANKSSSSSSSQQQYSINYSTVHTLNFTINPSFNSSFNFNYHSIITIQIINLHKIENFQYAILQLHSYRHQLMVYAVDPTTLFDHQRNNKTKFSSYGNVQIGQNLGVIFYRKNQPNIMEKLFVYPGRRQTLKKPKIIIVKCLIVLIVYRRSLTIMRQQQQQLNGSLNNINRYRSVPVPGACNMESSMKDSPILDIFHSTDLTYFYINTPLAAAAAAAADDHDSEYEKDDDDKIKMKKLPSNRIDSIQQLNAAKEQMIMCLKQQNLTYKYFYYWFNNRNHQHQITSDEYFKIIQLLLLPNDIIKNAKKIQLQKRIHPPVNRQLYGNIPGASRIFLTIVSNQFDVAAAYVPKFVQSCISNNNNYNYDADLDDDDDDDNILECKLFDYKIAVIFSSLILIVYGILRCAFGIYMEMELLIFDIWCIWCILINGQLIIDNLIMKKMMYHPHIDKYDDGDDDDDESLKFDSVKGTQNNQLLILIISMVITISLTFIICKWNKFCQLFSQLMLFLYVGIILITLQINTFHSWIINNIDIELSPHIESTTTTTTTTMTIQQQTGQMMDIIMNNENFHSQHSIIEIIELEFIIYLSIYICFQFIIYIIVKKIIENHLFLSTYYYYYYNIYMNSIYGTWIIINGIALAANNNGQYLNFILINGFRMITIKNYAYGEFTVPIENNDLLLLLILWPFFIIITIVIQLINVNNSMIHNSS